MIPGKPKKGQSAAELRQRAEKRVGRPTKVVGDAETARMLHELEVHQIELEMQNTELRNARDESEALLDKYTELYDFAPVGYFTLSTEGIIRLSNLTGSTIVGIERAILIGRSFVMLIAGAQRLEFRAFLKRVFMEEGKQSEEFDLANDKLATRIVRIEAQICPNGFECSVMVLDVTQRRKALQGMHDSEVRYRRLFEAAQDGILIIDPTSGKIIDANPYITRLLGYSRDQLLGKQLGEIGLLKDAAASEKMFRKLKKSHQVRYENLPMESKAGRCQQVEVIASLYQEGHHPVIQCHIRDITARKLAEEMSSRNLKLKKEILRREKVEETLRAQRKEQSSLLKHSRLQEKQLRNFSHRILNVQEEERKRISRELHDVIAQTLVGINVRLSVLDQDKAASRESFLTQISNTRELVEKAVKTIHDFARELRPTMLDDLGLIPALEMHMERFNADTGIRASLKGAIDNDQSTPAVRTALYRIALGALTNVAIHSKASRVEVVIESLENLIRMTIKDNGQGFQVIGKAGSRKRTRLGLISMRERAEMIGGSFQVESAPGTSTTVRVEIPVTLGNAVNGSVKVGNHK